MSSEVTLLRGIQIFAPFFFLFNDRPCCMKDVGRLDFRCVQTYMEITNKTWFGICQIKKERGGVYAITIFKIYMIYV